MSEEPKISARYRELPREEPPRPLDDAILAAARRAAETRPAPLVVPSGRRRWYFPLAAAAIIVLAVAVTIHVEREQPDAELLVVPTTQPGAPAPEPAAKAESPSKGFVPDPEAPAAPPRETRAQPSKDQTAASRERAQAEEAAQAAPAPASRAHEAQRTASALAGFAYQSPEQWLQGIADLRRQQRHDEADRALAEFRKRYPDYRIPEAMLERIEKR